MKSNRTGIARIQHAFIYSAKGFSAAWKNEAAFRQEVVACLLLIPLALWLGESNAEKGFLVLVLLLVLLTELFNSAIEAIVDRVGDEYHELSGRAKDIGSAAVLLSIFTVIVVWGVVLLF